MNIECFEQTGLISYGPKILREHSQRLVYDVLLVKKTSLLRRLQAQTLADEAPPMDKIHQFSKIAVTFEPVMRFGCPSGFRIS